MKTNFFVLIALVGLAGCATIQVFEGPQVVESYGTIPGVGATETVSVGSVIFSQHRLWKKSGLHIPSGYRGKVGGAEVDVAATDYLVKAVADSQEAYCTQRATMKNIFGAPIKPTCFVGPLGASHFTKVMVPSDAIWWSSELAEPLRFSKTEEDIMRPDSLRRELIYLGTAGKIMRIAYREYLGDMARPAFAQEVTYDVDKLPLEIAFKNAKFQVLEIRGSTLRYRVLNQL